jgi:DNA-binding NarL/FixJ family response regulator
MVLRACASDLTLTQQLVQLARLGAAALVANQAPGSSNPHGTHPGPSGSSLTTRETQVLSLVSNGHTVKQAADELGCTQSTANTHLSNVYRKLGVTDRTQAVLTARAGGII